MGRVPWERTEFLNEIRKKTIEVQEGENSSDFERRRTSGKVSKSATTADKIDSVRAKLMKLEPLLRLSENKRDVRISNMTYGAYPFHCTAQIF